LQWMDFISIFTFLYSSNKIRKIQNPKHRLSKLMRYNEIQSNPCWGQEDKTILRQRQFQIPLPYEKKELGELFYWVVFIKTTSAEEKWGKKVWIWNKVCSVGPLHVL
jgi:hypothetical protein